MKHKTFSTPAGCKVRQVNKTVARKIYESGGTLYMQSANMPFENGLQNPTEVKRRGNADLEFDKIVVEYSALNCDAVRGRYVNYFIKL